MEGEKTIAEEQAWILDPHHCPQQPTDWNTVNGGKGIYHLSNIHNYLLIE